MDFSGSRSFAMPSPRHRIAILAFSVTALLSASVSVRADKFPDFLAAEYQQYFARYSDNRTLPEQMLNAAGFTPKEYGRGFALIAGVSKYPNMTGSGRDLPPAAEDVRKLLNYLTVYEKFDEVVVLKDTQVTEANLSYFLQRYFPRRLQQFPKSRFLFAYSGHGTTVNNRGYILTSEARNLSDNFDGISMTTLRAMFQQIIDSGFHVLALINACYSGDFLKRSFGDTHYIPRYAGAHAITAGGTQELTWHDGSVGTGSIFFEKFFAALDGRAGGGDIVTVDDLAAYLRREVRISTDQQQNPLPGDLSRDGSLGGFFFFNRRPLVERKVLPEWDSAKGRPFGGASDSLNTTVVTNTNEDEIQKRGKLATVLNQATALQRAGKYDQAVAAANAAISLDPRNSIALRIRGYNYYELRKYDLAIADHSEAIRLDPQNANGWYARGLAYYSNDNYEPALSDLNEAIRLKSQFRDAFTVRGLIYRGKKEPTRAIAELNEAIRSDPEHPDAIATRCTVYLEMGFYDRALDDCNTAIRLNPKGASAYYSRGLAKIAKGNKPDGEADKAKARQLNPSIERDRWSRGTP
jgi:tetratricopeptide (TPR) repeat protein